LAGAYGKLYAVWKGEGSDETLYYAHYDGTNWSGQTPHSKQTPISGISSSVGAAIAEFHGNLYAMCKGGNSDVTLYNSEYPWSAWASDIPGNTGQDTNRTLLQLPGAAAPGLPGSSNYWFVDSGGREKHLTGASATLLVTADMVPSPSSTQAGGYQNYSFQMNCWSQPPSPSSPPTSYVWQQYGFRVANGLFFFWVNAFDISNNQQINWDSRFTPYQYHWQLPKNILPKGWQFTVNLATDATSGHVTGVSFTVANNENVIFISTPTLELINLVSSAGFSPNAGDEAKIDSFMIVLVGENTPGGPIVNFVSGQGIFLASATNNLAVTNSEPPRDSQSFIGTNENSNTKYSSLPTSYPSGEFYQLFGVGTN
jgi:hypothetical protein